MMWTTILLVIAVIIVARLTVYVVREAATLKAMTDSLRTELTQFKEGGFKNIVKEELRVLTTKATEELEARERAIRQDRIQSLDNQTRAARAAEEFNKNLGAVNTQLTSLKELQARVGQLNDLLKPQQLRGELGEVIVRTLISDKLPRGQYEEDYAFADGKKVEFVIRLNNRLIPVDSKLQLEDYKRMREAEESQRQTYRTQFRRAIRQKIDEVKQYIQPEEGTYNFALMVIPSEAVFYDLIANRDFTEEGGLYDYARTQNVFLVSPLTFWAYITAIAQGLRGLEIERRAEEILSHLQTLAADIREFSGNEFRLVGEHLRNASKNYDDAKSKLGVVTEGVASLERLKPTSQFIGEGVAT